MRNALAWCVCGMGNGNPASGEVAKRASEMSGLRVSDPYLGLTSSRGCMVV